MTDFLRRMLFSKQFFGILLGVLALDLTVDLVDLLAPGRHVLLNCIAIVVDLIALTLAGWMFLDLSRSRKPNGDDSHRR